MDMSPRGLEGEVWTQGRTQLWERIRRHDFEPAQPFNFVARLAHEQRWSLVQARAAVEAYRRFCFLAMISPTPVTPSVAVDEVWHLHLIYSRDYWDVWCGQVLRQPLHHDPTPGGTEAQRLYRQQYAQTLALHERFFEAPPAALWPATHERFARSPRYGIAGRVRAFVARRLEAALRFLSFRSSKSGAI